MARLDRHGRVATVPFQKPGVPEAHGLTLAECEAAAWAVTPDGRRYRGAAAINAALAWALDRPGLLQLYALPGVHQLQDAAYALIAVLRHRLPGVTPHCRQHPKDCGWESAAP